MVTWALSPGARPTRVFTRRSGECAWAIAARQSVTPPAAADPPVRESLRSQVDDEAGRVGQGAHLGVGALTECDRGVGPPLEPT